jgi:uncharacterized protein involved in exopolysaccharide biosynthesis
MDANGGRNGAADSGVTPMELVNELLRHRRAMVGVPVVLAFLVVGLGLMGDRNYTSNLSFVPQTSDAGLGGAGAIAAQFGVSVPGSDLTQTPDFYASLLRSEQMARQLVEGRYQVEDDAGIRVTANLVSIFGVEGATAAQSRDIAAEMLAQSMKVSSDLKTGAVRLDVTTKNPALSMQIAQRALDVVNEFNATTRRSRYGEEKRFVGGRVAESRQALRQAEDALQSFLDNNRDYTSSPPLMFTHDRLQREVLLRNQLYTTFAQQYEDARVQEARNTPVITVVGRPIPASRPDRRFLAFKGIAAMAFGVVLTAFLIIIRHFFARSRARDDRDAAEFLILWRETLEDARAQWRRVKRIIPGRRAARA